MPNILVTAKGMWVETLAILIRYLLSSYWIHKSGQWASECEVGLTCDAGDRKCLNQEYEDLTSSPGLTRNQHHNLGYLESSISALCHSKLLSLSWMCHVLLPQGFCICSSFCTGYIHSFPFTGLLPMFRT